MRLIYLLMMFLSFVGCTDQPTNTPKKSSPLLQTKNKQDIFLFVGDSLTAGYKLHANDAYPALIAENWQQQQIPIKVQNAAVSGYTSNDVLENLSWSLTDKVRYVFLAIGANDAMLGRDLKKCQQNIEKIIAICQSKKIKVILAQMEIPPNYNRTKELREIYPKVAAKLKVKLMPFLLEGVAGIEKYNFPDGIHPNQQGHKIVAQNVIEFLQREKVIQ